MKTSKMSELYSTQTIQGGSGTSYLVIDNHEGILTLLRRTDGKIYTIDWLGGKDHIVDVISTNHLERLKKDIPTLPDNFNEFLALIGA